MQSTEITLYLVLFHFWEIFIHNIIFSLLSRSYYYYYFFCFWYLFCCWWCEHVYVFALYLAFLWIMYRFYGLSQRFEYFLALFIFVVLHGYFIRIIHSHCACTFTVFEMRSIFIYKNTCVSSSLPALFIALSLCDKFIENAKYSAPVYFALLVIL